MPYQIQLGRKNAKAVEAIMGVVLENPGIGEVIELPKAIKARITAIAPTSVRMVAIPTPHGVALLMRPDDRRRMARR
jgi:hypothetical protein